MSKNIHSAEMHRLADAPQGTKVWQKAEHMTVWLVDDNPRWLKNFNYIVADEWAEIRKFFIDKGFIYLLDAVDGSIIKDFNPSYREDIKYYLTSKPDVVEPVYYYQYEKKYDIGTIEVSTAYYPDDKAIGYKYTEENGWFKIESSKREWGR